VFAGITLAPDPAPSPVRPPAAASSTAAPAPVLPRPVVSPGPKPPVHPAAKPAPKPAVVLAYGSTGANVRILQRKLSVTQTGFYGRVTQRAVLAFQHRYRLTADGVAGPVTLDRMHLHLT
jgi:peptidoglycan hydrolase-like protein with peptidoglycan-binding domain